MTWLEVAGVGLVAAVLLGWRLRVGFVAFRGRFRAHLRTAPDIEWRQDTSTGIVCAVSGLPLETDLLESYIYLIRHRQPEAELFDDLVTALRHRVPPTAPPPFALVRDRVLPVLRREADLVLSSGYRRQHYPIRSPLVGEVVVAYVIEWQFQMTTITEGVLSAWGMGIDELHALAVENLRAKTRHLLDELGGPQREYVALDGYDAARILVLDLIVPPAIADPRVAIPRADTCLIAPADRSAELAEHAATLFAQADLPLTAQVFAPTPDGRFTAVAPAQEAVPGSAKGQHTD